MRYAAAGIHSTGRKRIGCLVLAAMMCGGLLSASLASAQLESAIDALVAREPEVAAAFAAGADPRDLRLSSGQSLADYLAAAASAYGLVYRTIFPCRVLGTHLSTDGKMAADESRSFLIRGEIDLTPQGGPANGCGVPPTAEAVMMSFVVFRSDGNGALWTRAAGQRSYEPLVNYRTQDARNNSTIQRLCKGTCVADVDLWTLRAGAHVAARVTGYFLPLAATELPAHTHDGSEIVSGEVDESVIDPDLTRDTELLAHTTDVNNPHSLGLEQLTPTRAKGDLLVSDGANVVRLPVGTNQQVLVADATQPTGLRWGVPWPNPRFTDNADGTVTDNLTGLIWLKDASCDDLPGIVWNGYARWATALSAANALASGTCGLSDGSIAGDWRLPNRFELESLLAPEFHYPSLPNAEGTAKWTEGDAFSGVMSPVPVSGYWSSTTFASLAEIGDTLNAFYVSFNAGLVEHRRKSHFRYVWPVRGGQ